MWATDPDVLKHYAKHYKTGAAMPRALLDKVMATQKYGQGFATTEYLAAAMLDQSWYQLLAADAQGNGRASWWESVGQQVLSSEVAVSLKKKMITINV